MKTITKELSKEMEILKELGLPEGDIEYIRNLREKQETSGRWSNTSSV